MKKTLYLVLITLFLSIFLAGQIPGEKVEDELVAKAQQVIAALQANNYKDAARDFDPTMSKLLGPEKLAEVWTAMPQQVGAFKKQGTARKEQTGNHQTIVIPCEFEKMTLDARVTFDNEKRIAGLHFIPARSLSTYHPPSYASPSLFEEREVTIGSGEWALPGTLIIPKGNGPFPAVVLVHGSGPNDRDETVGANKPFKDLAWGLGSRGIAVLRYDKRTLVYGSKLVEDPKFAESFTVRQETTEDALAAVKFLKSEKNIDPQKIVVLGHSLGGMMIPRIAAEGKDLAAGYIIMAGLTRKIEDTILEQTNYICNLDGILSPEEEKILFDIDKAREKIKTFKKTDPPSRDIVMMGPMCYWLDLNEYEPTQMVKEIRKPIFVLQGGRDYQVTIVDFENWQKALSGRKNAEFKLYPALNHLFFEGEGKSTPDEYIKNQENVAVYVITDIAAWMKKI
ncbi:MAG: alpha/beta fold hydrolase [Acidobacteria bacterium]|jgi:hypothetical protein|nr:alpha/beta fold hydrolase [Acidobacteriota bacterium]